MSEPRHVEESRPRSGRILLVTPQPFYEDRGTPIAVADTCRALTELGYEVDLLAFPIGEPLQMPGLRIHRCANPFGIRKMSIGFSLSKCLLDATLLASFEHLLRTRHYDLVHAVEEAAYIAALLCPRYGVPFIYDMASSIPAELQSHKVLGTALAQRLLKASEHRVLRTAAHVVCSIGLGEHVSRTAPHVSHTEWRFPPITGSADDRTVNTLRSELDIDSDSHVVMYSGNFAGYQGMDLLFDAFERALSEDPDLMLVCVGVNEEARASTEAHLSGDVRSRVRIIPRKPRRIMPAFFALADCLVSLRPVSNNLPLKVFDYMAAGKPIVATKGLAHEPVLTKERAFLCEAHTENIKQAILEVFRSERRAQAVAQRARRHAMRHYGWERFVELVGGMYGNVLGRDRKNCANAFATAS
jgi:glycosyltransferase involved in cell wall biosynthesis